MPPSRDSRPPSPDRGQAQTGKSVQLSQRRSIAQSDRSGKYEAKRQALVASAAEVFREKGYEATTLSDIAERFGTDRASLYYYVASKEELFQEALRGVLDGNVAEAEEILAMDVGAREKLARLIRGQFAVHVRHYPHMYVYIQEDMRLVADRDSPWARQMAAQTRRYQEIVMTVIQSGISEGTLRPDVPVSLIANAMFGMVNWAHRWFKPGTGHSGDEVADAFIKVFLDGVDAAAAESTLS